MKLVLRMHINQEYIPPGYKKYIQELKDFIQIAFPESTGSPI